MAISKPPKISKADEDKLFRKYINRAADGSPKEAEAEPPATVATPEPPKEKPREPKESKAPVEKPARQPEQKRRKARAKKEPISVTIAPELLRKVNAAAQESGMSRAAYIAMALNYAVTHGIFK